VDRHPARLCLALELGATDVLDSRRNDLATQFADGLDGLVDTTGDLNLGRLAARVLKPRGRAAFLAGGAMPKAMQGRRHVSVIQGDSVPRRFIPEMIRLYRTGQFPFDRLIKFYDFAEINRAIADVRHADTIKAVLRIGTP